MRDQADSLRNIVVNTKSKEPLITTKTCKVFSVTSGKGGVGKTNMAVNMAVNLSGMGYRVVLLDADFGLANIDILFGNSPKFTLLDLVEGRKTILEILNDGPMNIKYISCGSGIEKMLRLGQDKLSYIIEKMSELDDICDIIIVDTGAGVGDVVMNFVMAADEIILITTPEPTSIMDSYALIKSVVRRNPNMWVNLIINRADSKKEAENANNKILSVCRHFLNFDIHPLGYILYDGDVVKSVKEQIPFSMKYPKSQANRQVDDIVHRLVKETDTAPKPETKGVKGFLAKFMKFNKK